MTILILLKKILFCKRHKKASQILEMQFDDLISQINLKIKDDF